jgi:hypothetical protein
MLRRSILRRQRKFLYQLVSTVFKFKSSVRFPFNETFFCATPLNGLAYFSGDIKYKVPCEGVFLDNSVEFDSACSVLSN